MERRVELIIRGILFIILSPAIILVTLLCFALGGKEMIEAFKFWEWD